MTTKRAKASQTAQKPSKKAKLKLVGYMEERDIADRCQAEWKRKGFDSSSVLREAFRAILNGSSVVADEWTIKESVLARRVGLNKVTLKRMRLNKELVDEQGPLWKKRGVHILYDVARTRAFFMKPVNASLES
jgi:hypothetical protein